MQLIAFWVAAPTILLFYLLRIYTLPEILETDETLDFILAITSTPTNESFEYRRIIRESWLKELYRLSSLKFKHYFVIGRSSNPQIENDLLQLDITESYYNLTNKTIATINELEKKERFTYFVKIDQDVFLNWPVFIDKISELPNKRLYYGFTWRNAPKVNLPSIKNHEDIFPFKTYPSFNAGPMYIISSDLIRLISMESKIAIRYKNEDVNIGIWLSPYDIDIIHDPMVQIHSFSCSPKIVALHSCSVSRLWSLYLGWVRYDNICYYESRVAPRYCLFGVSCDGTNEWNEHVICDKLDCRYKVDEDEIQRFETAKEMINFKWTKIGRY